MEPDDRNDAGLTDVADIVWDAISRDGRVAWHASERNNSRYLYRPDQLLVDLKYESALAGALKKEGAKRKRCHGSQGRSLERLGLRRYWLPGRKDAKAAIDRIRASVPDERAAAAITLTHVFAGAPVFKFGPGDLPHDAGPDQVEPEPSKRPGTGKGVRVSILDTGFVASSTQRHPLLSRGYSDDGDDGDVLIDDVLHEIRSVFGGHGTFIAGIIRQLAPDTDLDPEVTLDDVGLIDDVELAQDLLRQRKAHIVNLSLAGPSEDDLPPQALYRALRELCTSSEAVFVAAAGNDFLEATKAGAPERKMWPAAFGAMDGFEHVVGVAAVQDGEHELVPAHFTNRGPWVRASAYGVNLRSTYVEGKLPAPPLDFPNATAKWSGTSFATPRVAGIIAATMTSSDPPLSPRQALAEVLDNASPGPTGCGVFVD